MKIIVGTKNKAKLDAVRDLFADYDNLCGAEVQGIATDSGVSDQPFSLEETVRGALNRARSAFESASDTSYGVGIESGLMEVPYTKSGFLDVCACVFYNGTEHFVGLSSAWEFPNPQIIRAMHDEGLDMSQASVKFGLTDDAQIGAKEGAIGIVSKGRITRKEYTQEAIRNALFHIS